ncbi:MAG: EAL domain-containing protein, partial [Myxococcota bacterium]
MRRIAVVDDETVVHDLIRDIVRDENLEVVSFGSVAEVDVGDAIWNDVHVALVDKVLPDGSGLELARSILSHREDIEVIVVTGHASLDSALEAVQVGASDYLLKPFDDIAIVLHRIKTAVDRARLRRDQENLLAKVLESEQRYALAAMGANDGLWDWNLSSEHFYASERWLDIVGLERVDPEMNFEMWMQLIHPEDRDTIRDALRAHLKGDTEQFAEEFRIQVASRTKWVLARGMAFRDRDRTATRMAGSLADIQQRKEVEAQLAHDAMHDGLTGLPNRSLVHDRLTRAMARARRNYQNFAVLFLDMDRFKTINDSLGHLAGDELLLEAAKRMASCLRETDTVARLGGDEFVIIIDELAEETDATRVAERIQEKLQRPFELSGHEVYSTVSIGIALYNDRYKDAEEMLRDADIAMYRAKAAGKACYRVFDEAMHRRAMDLLRLETDLRRAVERNEFRLQYQPIVDLESRVMVGCEALLRWDREGHSSLLPEGFISLAEETGLIIPIGRWVTRMACEQLREINRRRDEELRLSINVSGRQFAQPDFADEVDAIIRQSGVRPDSITLEVTESVIMEDPEFARRMLEQLKALDVQLAIDDFGTGYSSLSYLQKFPVDRLKIDRSFVSLLEEGGYELEIVKTIIHLART